MDRKCIAVVLACALLACVLGADVSTVTTTAGPVTTSTAGPTTTSTAGPVTTTTAGPVTTSTPEPVTTSTAGPVTTTTPSAPVTTTAAPPPSDKRGNWSVDSGNETCIVAQMVIGAKITYELTTPNKTDTVEVYVPVKANPSGVCGTDSQNLTLSWGQHSVDIVFKKNDTTRMYYVNHIALKVFADNKTFPNISSNLVDKDYTFEISSELFKTNFNQSYRCIREESLPLNKSGNISAALILDKVQLEAFRTKSDKVFATAQDCELDTPDIVPIAVGCALAALVFVVLVAYLVGRRRSQARGYLSM